MTAIEPPCFYSHSIWTKQSQITFTEKWVFTFYKSWNKEKSELTDVLSVVQYMWKVFN